MGPTNTSRRRTSREWVDHFRENLKLKRIDWNQPATLDSVRDRKLVRSLQAWQRGETSDGSHLLAAAAKYAQRCGDPDYFDAVKLFITEEQKHGENLGKYLDAIGAPRISFDLGDWLFRRVRYFNTSMEIWTITVIIVEMFAQFYYASLAKAANCPLLDEICRDILLDEAPHIRFQAERLQTFVAGRSHRRRVLSMTFYRWLFYVVTISIWMAHGEVFRQSGIGFFRYWRKAYGRFLRLMGDVHELADATTVSSDEVI